MARLNIEDTIDADPRFRRLARLLGDEDKALGLVVRFWRLAQMYWGKGELVPEVEVILDGFEPIVQCGLAEKREEGIYARGSEERFAWYAQRCKASAKGVGSRSHKASRPERMFRSTGTHVPLFRPPKLTRRSHVLTASNQGKLDLDRSACAESAKNASLESRAESGSRPERMFRSTGTPNLDNPLTLKANELSSSDLLDLRARASSEVKTSEEELRAKNPNGFFVTSVPAATSQEKSLERSGSKKGKLVSGVDTSKFIARYVEEFEGRYGTRPALDRIAVGEARRVVEGVGLKKSLDVVTAYLQLNDGKYLAKCHDLTSLRCDLNRVVVSLDKGVEDPQRDAEYQRTLREFKRRNPE